MKENKLQIIINKPVKEVFQFTINPRNTHKWIEGIYKEEAEDWPTIKEGSKYRNKEYKDGEWTGYIVQNIEENRSFELIHHDHSYHVQYSYNEVEPNKTKLTYYEWVDEGELEFPFSQKTMEKLKEIIESTNK